MIIIFNTNALKSVYNDIIKM